MNMAISQKNAEKPFNPTKHEANMKINEKPFYNFKTWKT
jgi:hypothetical protein